MGSGAQVVA